VDEQRPLIPVEYYIGKLKPFTRQAILDSGAGPQSVQLDDKQLAELAKDKDVKREKTTLISATGEEKREKLDGSLRVKGMKTSSTVQNHGFFRISIARCLVDLSQTT